MRHANGLNSVVMKLIAYVLPVQTLYGDLNHFAGFVPSSDKQHSANFLTNLNAAVNHQGPFV